MFTKTTAATTTKTTTKRSIRALALAGVMAITASACSIGGTAVEADATKSTSTTITQDQNQDTQNQNDQNQDGQNDRNQNPTDEVEAPESPATEDADETADESSDQDEPQTRPAPRPEPAPKPTPEPEPAYVVGACEIGEYPALDTYVAYADAELRTEPVIGTPIEVIFAGDIAFPYFTEFDCAIGDDDTVWWFIGTEFGTEAWVNAGWLDPVDGSEEVDYTAAVLHYVARDCIEHGIDVACDELFNRNDDSASAIGSSFVAAYMAGDIATLDNLSTLELQGTWAGLLPTEDITGDGFGAESLSISGNTISFVPFPTGGVTCYADAGEIAYCSYSE